MSRFEDMFRGRQEILIFFFYVGIKKNCESTAENVGNNFTKNQQILLTFNEIEIAILFLEIS